MTEGIAEDDSHWSRERIVDEIIHSLMDIRETGEDKQTPYKYVNRLVQMLPSITVGSPSPFVPIDLHNLNALVITELRNLRREDRNCCMTEALERLFKDNTDSVLFKRSIRGRIKGKLVKRTDDTNPNS